jgi:YfiH family protein
VSGAECAAASNGFLTHPLLQAASVAHGFGLRGSPAVAGLVRPRQVHGRDVARVRGEPPEVGLEADAVVTTVPGLAVGIATADCVPVLLAANAGRVVAAVHAGWRGLALGVVAAGLEALREEAGSQGAIVVAIGPHIGPCCYEVDEPVIEALRERFGGALDAALRPSRPGHARLELARLVRRELELAGVRSTAVGLLADACTHCDAARYHSYRRDGARAGRLLHWIRARGARG